jgi:hypothetical protein
VLVVYLIVDAEMSWIGPRRIYNGFYHEDVRIVGHDPEPFVSSFPSYPYGNRIPGSAPFTPSGLHRLVKTSSNMWGHFFMYDLELGNLATSSSSTVSSAVQT